ncbi:hypothetical protein [Fusobacterium hwasookii]|uniref:hypothetical protein n=1 Tax=Fusobacterium hwasookii TaxID=1583098 RepID=UPI0028EF3B51|nr:hypothetical protein [Fusobacterium hwasookii]
MIPSMMDRINNKEEEIKKENERIYNILYKEFKNQTDRGIAITFVAFLDDYLGKVLINFFIEDTNSQNLVEKNLTIYTKINLAYYLGLISKEDKSRFLKINTIRNTFAHNFEISNFSDDDKIKKNLIELCQDLFQKKIGDTDLKNAFFNICNYLNTKLSYTYATIKDFNRLRPCYDDFEVRIKRPHRPFIVLSFIRNHIDTMFDELKNSDDKMFKEIAKKHYDVLKNNVLILEDILEIKE